MALIDPTPLTPLSTFRVPATPLARATIWAYGVYGVVQGAIILATDEARFSGLSFATIRTVPGGPHTWGLAALALGLVILVASVAHRFVLKAVGLLGLAGWSICFALGLLDAALKNPNASTTGIPTYVLLAVAAAILVWVDERKAYRP